MRAWNVVLGGGVLAVLVALTVSVVRSVREVLAVEKERRRRMPLVVAGRGQSAGARHAAVSHADAPPSGVVRGAGGFLPAVGPSRMPFGGPEADERAAYDELATYLDDEIAATARRIIRDQGLIP